MTHHRSQWNRSHVHWAKKQNHDDDIPPSSRNATAREPPKGDAWNNWEEAGKVENQGVRWNVPLKFEGANREEYRVVFDWDDLAAKEAYYSPAELTLQDYLADCERYSAHIDWETRRYCSLPECSEVMSREESKRKSKGSYTRQDNTRVGSPVIVGLPSGRDISENDGVSSIHLPLFAVPPATGWGDEGDVVPTPTGWGEKNTAPPILTGWGDNGDVSFRPGAVWEDKKESAPNESGCDGGGFAHGNAAVSQRRGVPIWVEVAARPAVSERSEVTPRHGSSKWAEVAARPGVSERVGLATENQVSGWEGSTVETLGTPAASTWEPSGPVVSGWEEFSHAQDPMNTGWMQHSTFLNNPESYKHIVPSGWGDFPEDSEPTTDVEMKPYCNSCEGNWIAHDLSSSSRSGYDRAGCGTSYGTGHVHQDKQKHGPSGTFKYGSEYWKLNKESEPRNNFESHYRRSSQRPGRSPIANNLRVYQDSKPSRGSRWDRTKTSVWQAACALSHDERTSLMKKAKNGIRT